MGLTLATLPTIQSPRANFDAVEPAQITYPASEYQRNWARYRAEMRRLD